LRPGATKVELTSGCQPGRAHNCTTADLSASMALKYPASWSQYPTCPVSALIGTYAVHLARAASIPQHTMVGECHHTRQFGSRSQSMPDSPSRVDPQPNSLQPGAQSGSQIIERKLAKIPTAGRNTWSDLRQRWRKFYFCKVSHKTCKGLQLSAQALFLTGLFSSR